MGTQGYDAVVPSLPERAEGVITSFCIIIPILFNVFCTKYDYLINRQNKMKLFMQEDENN